MLSERQARFVEAYISGAGRDAAAAAEAAGYSPGRARRQARALLKNPEVAAALQKAAPEPADAPVQPEQVLRELARIAFADPADLLDGDGGGDGANTAPRRGSGTGLKLKYTPRRAPGPDGETVMEVSMEREVRVGDKLRALELLSKYLGLAAAPAGEGEEGSTGVIVLPEVEEGA